MHVTPSPSAAPRPSRRRPGSASRGRRSVPTRPEVRDVSVVVVDTGWHSPQRTPTAPHPGSTGVTGDAETVDPNRHPSLCRARHLHRRGHALVSPGGHRLRRGFRRQRCDHRAANGVGGGGVLESDIVQQLIRPSTTRPDGSSTCRPGAARRGDLGPLTFEVFWESHLKGRGCVLVAAAGNDSSPAPFWPAAFPWAVRGGIAGPRRTRLQLLQPLLSADVYALGRNLVNAFPDGTYTCHESPNRAMSATSARGWRDGVGRRSRLRSVAGLIAAQDHCARWRSRPQRGHVLDRRPGVRPGGRADQGARRRPYCTASSLGHSTIHSVT